MALNKKIQEIVEQTQKAHLRPIKEQSLTEMRAAFANLKTLQGELRALPKVEGMFIPTKGGEIPLRLYYPALQRILPVILYFHPGGYVKGDLESHDAVCRELAYAAHALVVSVGYRLAPEHSFPTPLIDGESAYRWILKHGKEIYADPKRVAFCGESSGGNLAAALANHHRNTPHLQAVALIYPQVDYTFSLESHKLYKRGYLLEEESLIWYRAQYVPKGHDLKDPDLSPLFASDLKGGVPTLILAAEYDPLKDECLAYADKLQKDGVKVRCEVYAGMTHGFFQMAGIIDEGNQAMAQVSEFLKEALYA